jgi:hypothetical protein
MGLCNPHTFHRYDISKGALISKIIPATVPTISGVFRMELMDGGQDIRVIPD